MQFKLYEVQVVCAYKYIFIIKMYFLFVYFYLTRLKTLLIPIFLVHYGFCGNILKLSPIKKAWCCNGLEKCCQTQHQ